MEFKNRYMEEGYEAAWLEEIDIKFTYHPPDVQRAAEHARINDAMLTAAKVIAETCPRSQESEYAIFMLWLARASANGALATHVQPAE